MLSAHWQSLLVADLTTRSGLKKIHGKFEDIQRRMDKEFRVQTGNWMVQGGIVGIYCKMCVDSLLRNKVFKEGASVALIMTNAFLTTSHSTHSRQDSNFDRSPRLSPPCFTVPDNNYPPWWCGNTDGNRNTLPETCKVSGMLSRRSQDC